MVGVIKIERFDGNKIVFYNRIKHLVYIKTVVNMKEKT